SHKEMTFRENEISLPRPEVVEKFEALFPGAAKLLLEESLEISKTIRRNDDIIVRHALRLGSVKVYGALGVSAGLMGLAAYLANLGINPMYLVVGGIFVA